MSLWLTLVVGSLAYGQTSLVPVSSELASGTSGAAKPVHPAPPPSNLRPTFSLGIAGSPFGWSTVIADFNADGTPDLIIADRTSSRAHGYAYRLHFAISTLAPRDVRFESERDALTVAASDVDQDRDLDVVVSALPSREIVAVWLNDGRGSFGAGEVRNVTSDLQPLQSVRATDSSRTPSTSELPSRDLADGLLHFGRVTPAGSPRALGTVRPDPLQSSVLTSAIAPRAPPRHPADSLS